MLMSCWGILVSGQIIIIMLLMLNLLLLLLSLWMICCGLGGINGCPLDHLDRLLLIVDLLMLLLLLLLLKHRLFICSYHVARTAHHSDVIIMSTLAHL